MRCNSTRNVQWAVAVLVRRALKEHTLERAWRFPVLLFDRVFVCDSNPGMADPLPRPEALPRSGKGYRPLQRRADRSATTRTPREPHRDAVKLQNVGFEREDRWS